MASKVKPIPDGYHSVTPVLQVDGAARLIDFLKQAFGAKEKERYTEPSGKIVHAEVTIGDSIVQLSDAMAEWKPVQVPLLLYVGDTAATYKRALKAGASSFAGADGRVLRRPGRRREGFVRQLVVDRHAPGRCLARGTRAARRGRAEERALAGSSPR